MIKHLENALIMIGLTALGAFLFAAEFVTNESRAIYYGWIRRHKCLLDLTFFPDVRLLATAHRSGPWIKFRYQPEVAEWCRESLKGRYGILPCIAYVDLRASEDGNHMEHVKTFWFSREADMILFKMRWM